MGRGRQPQEAGERCLSDCSCFGILDISRGRVHLRWKSHESSRGVRHLATPLRCLARRISPPLPGEDRSDMGWPRVMFEMSRVSSLIPPCPSPPRSSGGLLIGQARVCRTTASAIRLDPPSREGIMVPCDSTRFCLGPLSANRSKARAQFVDSNRWIAHFLTPVCRTVGLALSGVFFKDEFKGLLSTGRGQIRRCRSVKNWASKKRMGQQMRPRILPAADARWGSF